MICSLYAQGQNDYVIQFDDTLVDVTLDKQYQIVVKGETINFKISSKDTFLFINKMYSFSHLKDFKVTKTEINPSIEQSSIMTSGGTGLIIQEYTSLNPTSLNEIMLNEMTKESISYGYALERSTYKRKLISGQEIEVTKAVLRYNDDINIYEVASVGKKDAGILVVTIKMDENIKSPGQKLIDLMWETLRFN